MKLEKKDKVYIFFIVILSVLLMGLFLLTISGWFYSDNRTGGTNLEIGNSSVIEVDGMDIGVLSFNFDGAILAGEYIKQNISVKNSGEDELYLRAKITLFSSNHKENPIFFKTNASWTLFDDGYYYFSDSVESLGTVALASGLVVSNEKQLASRENYILTIVVESLSTRYDRLEAWGR